MLKLQKKETVNWRHIFRIKKIDMCNIVNGIYSLPFSKNILQTYNDCFPEFPFKCPPETGKYASRNVCLKNLNNFVGTPFETAITPNMFPNGIYKITLRVFTNKDADTEGFLGTWQYEIHARLNDGKFWTLNLSACCSNWLYINWNVKI